MSVLLTPAEKESLIQEMKELTRPRVLLPGEEKEIETKGATILRKLIDSDIMEELYKLGTKTYERN